ncbi:MAG: alpha/beta fold hydrolase [Deltaproteobacteria bacterium]|nr:alpha/beta fold hydrolase [Deltaproteobacteria bacterium]
MSWFRRSLHVLSLGVLSLAASPLGCEAPATAPPVASSAPVTPPALAPSAVQHGARVAAGIRYLVRYTGGARADQQLPMVVAIHGLGDRPERFAGLLAGLEQPARLIVPQGLDPYHGGFSWFPIRVADQDPEAIAQGMRRAAARLADMLTELGKRHPTEGKPVVTGFSQGGMLSFALAVEHPQVVAAAIPLAGWLPPPMWPSTVPAQAPPIVALHGDADPLLTIQPTRDAVRQLRQAGFAVELHEYPGVRHTVSPAMRRQLYRQLAPLLVGRATP